MTLEEIIRMAREAGVVADEDNGYLELWNFAKLVAAHERVALAEQEKQEPVAWRIGNEICARDDWACVIPHGSFVGKGRAIPDSWVPLLYAAPVSAKREWVELTDDEILAAVENCPLDNRIEAAKAGITAFNEKNK